LNIFEHLYSPRMVGKIKERKNNWNIKQKIVIPGIYRWSFEIFCNY